MMKIIFCTLIVCYTGISAFASTEISPEIKEQLKKPIIMENGQKRKVTFNHDTHESIECTVCHHKALEDGSIYVSCASKGCHDIMDRKDKSEHSYFLAIHKKDTDKSCLGCHQKLASENPELKKIFIGCKPCHSTAK